MTRLAVLAAAFLSAAAAVEAQEVVRLNNGRHVSGTVDLDDSDREGFRLRRWDNAGTLYIRWSQVPVSEKNRLLNITPQTGPVGEMLAGVSVLTDTREVRGLLVDEDAQKLLIKRAESPSPVPVPRASLQRPIERIQIPETMVYSPAEMVDNRLAKADPASYDDMLKVGRFAASLKLYERAKELYQKAQAADASKKDEIEPILAENDILIREGKAAAMLAEAHQLAGDAQFEQALEKAKALLAEYADTEAAKSNADLVSRLEQEAKDFQVRKAEYLAKNVPEKYKLYRSSLFSRYSNRKYTLSDARGRAPTLDEEVVTHLAELFKATPDEIREAWGKREQKIRTATYGDGSWIVRGGQSGGLDTDAKTKPAQPRRQNNFGNQFGQRRGRQRRAPEPKPLGQKLQTDEEWWRGVSSSQRRRFIEAAYAEASSAITRVSVEESNCRHCRGEGVLNGNRLGYQVEVKCPRCHGAKVDVVIKYW